MCPTGSTPQLGSLLGRSCSSARCAPWCLSSCPLISASGLLFSFLSLALRWLPGPLLLSCLPAPLCLGLGLSLGVSATPDLQCGAVPLAPSVPVSVYSVLLTCTCRERKAGSPDKAARALQPSPTQRWPHCSLHSGHRANAACSGPCAAWLPARGCSPTPVHWPPPGLLRCWRSPPWRHCRENFGLTWNKEGIQAGNYPADSSHADS